MAGVYDNSNINTGIIRPHCLHVVHKMRPIATDVACSVVCVCVCVCVLRIWMRCAKKAE